jgi:thiamine biosynthesis protein ThiS
LSVVKIAINGQTKDSRGAQTIAELVERYELPIETVLLEHNGIALHRHEWSTSAIAEGDQIEIVRVAAGG